MKNFELAKQLFLDGITFLENNDFQKAEINFTKSLALVPNRISTLTNLSAAQIKLEKYSEAKISLEQAISIDPNNSEAFLNLGLLEKEVGSLTAAIDYFDRSILLDQFNSQAYLNRGAALNSLTRFEDALAAYEKALSIKPDLAEAWSNKGTTLHELRRFEDALAAYEKALSIKPDLAEAWSNKGTTLHELRRFEDALASYEKALSIKPEMDWLPGKLIHTRMVICSWDDFEENLEILTNQINLKKRVSDPFPLLALTDNNSLLRQCSEIYAGDKYPPSSTLGAISLRDKKGKIRIGYFSADFHNHATGHLMAELFELHDKSQFEVLGFSFGPVKNDQMRQRLASSFDKFIEVGESSDLDIAKLSRSLNVDIAVDLKGFTQHARSGIFSYRAAPIQISYLGYPGTTGTNYIDYIIADTTLIPKGSERFYSEKVAFLPNSYQVNDRKRIISNKNFTKKELGLPENGFIFCCFNNNYKILPSTFDRWMRILSAVDGSVLWLLEDNVDAVKNLKKEAIKRGVSEDRLIFAKRMQLPVHLARHSHIDLFIDTFPYNAHTTASDALWAGVPILTLSGESFASRVASSLLNALDLSELISHSPNEYEASAIRLATNPNELKSIREKLSRNRLNSSLFDTPLFTKNLERIYTQMYLHYQTSCNIEHLPPLPH